MVYRRILRDSWAYGKLAVMLAGVSALLVAGSVLLCTIAVLYAAAVLPLVSLKNKII